MMNVVILVGRLTADPELKTSPGGKNYCKFSVAVDRGYVKAGEERKADFINCTAWDKTAEFVSNYFEKGKWIAVEGSLRQDNYTNRDGVKMYSYNVNVNSVSFVGDKKSGDSDYSSNRASSESSYSSQPQQSHQQFAKPSQAASYSSGSDNDFLDDSSINQDLPF